MPYGLSTTAFRREIGARLTHAATVARAALGCAEGGFERDHIDVNEVRSQPCEPHLARRPSP